MSIKQLCHVFLGFSADLRHHWVLALRAVLIGWAVHYIALNTVDHLAGLVVAELKKVRVVGAMTLLGEVLEWCVVVFFAGAITGSTVALSHRIVGGTSGDTLLQPIDATLGGSRLSARGSVIRARGAKRRAVALDVVMTGGRIEDLLLLSVKSPQPLMVGEIDLRTEMVILSEEQAFERGLFWTVTFDVEQALFTGVSIQEKIDSLSRRAQGKPKDQKISEMLSYIGGGFNLRDGEIRFATLTFQVPGTAVHLKGSYGLDSEQIDLHGVARLRAKLSQTMTGWKRIALKPVDPFFSKAGAGTLLPIKVTGTREKPEFGLDRGARAENGREDRVGGPPAGE